MSLTTLIHEKAATPAPVVGRVVLAPAAPSSLTEAVLQQPVRDPFIGDHEMFHVEKMGGFKGHFTFLGRALERLGGPVVGGPAVPSAPPRPCDIAHAHALAEELTRQLHLMLIETRCDAEGVAGKVDSH